MAEEKPSRAGGLSTLESVAKVGAAGMAIIYAIGFIVVQANLALLGFPGVGDFRMRYLATGFFWLLLSAASVAIGYAVPLAIRRGVIIATESWLRLSSEVAKFIAYLRERRDGRAPAAFLKGFGRALSSGGELTHLARELWQRPLYPLTLVAAYAGAIGLISHSARTISPGADTLLNTYCLICGAAGLRLGIDALSKSDRIRALARNLVRPEAVLLALSLVGFYGYLVYPRVPAGWGGGLGVPAIIRLDEDASVLPRPAATRGATCFMPDAGTSGCAGVVLDQSASAYLLLLHVPAGTLDDFYAGRSTRLRGTACELPRAKVRSIVYLPWDTKWSECGEKKQKGCTCSRPPAGSQAEGAGARSEGTVESAMPDSTRSGGRQPVPRGPAVAGRPAH